jgi:serine/threonine-protein kinase
VLGGRYRLDRMVASGGMAQVWEATDEVLARRVAVKLLHPHLAADESFVARFRREAVAAARLSHPSIVSIYDTCADDDCEAIVMELVTGVTLRELLDERKFLEPSQAVAIVAEVADALETAHRGGVVHRDVKPANILLSNDGRVLVADFGIAKAGGDLTTTNTTLGTAKYLAPEQVEGRAVDARADVYALGVVLYEALCGRAPFIADTEAATALARLHQEPMRPRNVRAGVPKPLEDVVLKAMARDADQRYPSAAAFRAELLAAGRSAGEAPPLTIAAPAPPPGDATVATMPVKDPTPSTPPTFVRTERGWLVPTVVIVVIGAALILAGVLFAGGAAHLPGLDNTPDNGGPATGGVTISKAVAYDPFGGGSENNDQAGAAVDGDPSTFWETEGYNSAAIQIKPGVGLYVTLASSAELADVEVTSQTSGWTAEIYVVDGPPPDDLGGWGDPVTKKEGIKPGTTTFDLGGVKGSSVLVWFTNLGNGSPDDNGRPHGQIAEVAVHQK